MLPTTPACQASRIQTSRVLDISSLLLTMPVHVLPSPFQTRTLLVGLLVIRIVALLLHSVGAAQGVDMLVVDVAVLSLTHILHLFVTLQM